MAHPVTVKATAKRRMGRKSQSAWTLAMAGACKPAPGVIDLWFVITMGCFFNVF